MTSVGELEEYDPASDGNLTSDGTDGNDEVVEELQAEHGVRPRRYNGFMNGSNEAERCFAELVTNAVDFINGRLAARGLDIRVDEFELATNFITEGGYYILDGNVTTRIDGFGLLGVDSLVSNFPSLRPYMHERVIAAAEEGGRTVEVVGETGDQWRSLTDLAIDEGFYANVGMYAWAKAIAAQHMRERGIEMSSLPVHEQVFWATLYYNAGPGTGESKLEKLGLDYARTPWSKADDAARFSSKPLFNGQWRTASYRFMKRTVGPIGQSCSEGNGGLPCRCDRCSLVSRCDRCLEGEGCSWCGDEWGTCSSTCPDYSEPVASVDECPAGSIPRECGEAINCEDCANIDSACGWCASSGECVAGNLDGPTSGECEDYRPDWDGCYPPSECSQSTKCDTCLAKEGCGWCPALGQCAAGGAGGPAAGACPGWVDAVAECSETELLCPEGTKPVAGDKCLEVHPCEDVSACASCLEADGCGWCDSLDTCMPGGLWGPEAGHVCPDDFDVTFASLVCDNTETKCENALSCDACVRIDGCSWCDEMGNEGCRPADAPSCAFEAATTLSACPDTDFCKPPGEPCTGDEECCSSDTDPHICEAGTCIPDHGCTRTGSSCTSGDECCVGTVCGEMDTAGTTQCCGSQWVSCAADDDCCGHMTCDEFNTCACREEGESCIRSRECCGDLLCGLDTNQCEA